MMRYWNKRLDFASKDFRTWYLSPPRQKLLGVLRGVPASVHDGKCSGQKEGSDMPGRQL